MEAGNIGHKQMEENLAKEDIHFQEFYHDPYFFAGDYPLAITLQRKQK